MSAMPESNGPTTPAVEEHRAAAPETLGFGAVTVSDSRTPDDDASGRLIREMVEAAGHRLVESLLVPDHPAEIKMAVRTLLSTPGIDVVVTTGGTGLSPRDVTIESVLPLVERELPGFGELFRMLSYEQVGSAAMLSRAAAGTVDTRAVFCLPGSPKAVKLAMKRLVLPEAAHLVGVLARPTRAPARS